MSARSEVVKTGPRLYATVNKHKDQEYYDYENSEYQTGDINKYELLRKLGRGKYSEVYSAIETVNNKQVVIKVLKPIKRAKIKREIKILKALKHPNIISLTEVVEDPASQNTSLVNLSPYSISFGQVFEYIPHQDFRDLFSKLSDWDVRYYIYHLFKALDYSHSCGIMHRDVKPQNIIVDHPNKTIKLIDWGLAQFYHLHQDYNVRVASRYFKGPELLVEYNYYDYSLDVWSLGCMFASMLFQKQPFFFGSDNRDQLVKIVQVLGSEDLWTYMKKYNINLEPDFLQMIPKCPRKPWSRYVPENSKLCSEEALDLLNKMLVYDHTMRILPTDALRHRYFQPIRSSLAPKPGPKQPK